MAAASARANKMKLPHVARGVALALALLSLGNVARAQQPVGGVSPVPVPAPTQAMPPQAMPPQAMPPQAVPAAPAVSPAIEPRPASTPGDVPAAAGSGAVDLAAPVPGVGRLRELSPWSMFLSADILVKAVMIGLAFASLVTWTIFLAKTVLLSRAQTNSKGRWRGSPTSDR